MRTIHKYVLDGVTRRGDRVQIQLPLDAVPLHVGLQGSLAMLWCEVDTDRPLVTRTVAVFGTGDEITAPTGVTLRYVGSVQGFAGQVWHYYLHEYPS